MSNLKKLTILGVALLVVVGFVVATDVKADGGIKVEFSGSLKELVLEVQDILQAAEPVEEPTVGAVTSPDIQSNCFSHGGLRKCAWNVPFQNGTSTRCSIEHVATSSIDKWYVQTKAGTTTATQVTFALGAVTGDTSSTTRFGSGSFAANTFGSLRASSSIAVFPATQPDTSPDDIYIIGPNIPLNVTFAGAIQDTGWGVNDIGSCFVEITELQ